MKFNILFQFLLCFIFCNTHAQSDIIYTKEGKPILHRKQLISNCLTGLNTNRSNTTAVSICECQVQKVDRHFTTKQYRQYTKAGIIDMSGLVKEDSVFEKEFQQCYFGSGQTILLEAQGFEGSFLKNCRESLKKNTQKNLDETRVNNFCKCQLDLVKTKKITDEEMETLLNPNSLLFYEVIYKCGDPFAENERTKTGWTSKSETDIHGPAIDTLSVLNLNGMTYVKIKTGNMVQFWLLDTGASDFLINKDMESELKKEGFIKEEKYLGIGEYEMANGVIDTCRRYSVDKIQIGKFSIDNVVIAVTDKGKRIIAGKSLLNKFTNWIIDNKQSILILNK